MNDYFEMLGVLGSELGLPGGFSGYEFKDIFRKEGNQVHLKESGKRSRFSKPSDRVYLMADVYSNGSKFEKLAESLLTMGIRTPLDCIAITICQKMTTYSSNAIGVAFCLGMDEIDYSLGKWIASERASGREATEKGYYLFINKQKAKSLKRLKSQKVLMEESVELSQDVVKETQK